MWAQAQCLHLWAQAQCLDNKKPISDENDHRMLRLEKDFTCYMRNIQEESIAGKGEFTDETYRALLFTTKATVETTRFLLIKEGNQICPDKEL
ncbi:hypothetical protein HPB49_007079 [Dermacentor silvarum]|uniref:Uncharacterized protein n=1 Tax=Dermacentor silvarum TaxID=543639 RepID=A0ACB8DN91_DERSI|nr:hypothetical protein HPB49_007079 [Dermacentor silvarum]